MKKIVYNALCTFALLSVSLNANAVMASPDPVIYTNPDGSKVELRLFGDERFSYSTTSDGYIVRADKQGRLFYVTADGQGNLLMSDQAVTEAGSRSDSELRFLETVDKDNVMALTIAGAAKKESNGSLAGPAYAPTQEKISSFPCKGSPKVLVILAEYQDVRFRSGAKEQINDMLNKRGYNYNGASGSALDYFSDSSDGKFTPQFDVYGPVTLQYDREYYGGHTSSANDQRAPEMIAEACKALDSEINFADYDCDNDGYCDNVYLFFAGQGEADSGIENTIWPHAWYLSGHRCHFYADGVLVNRYATSAELNTSGSTTYPTGIGTFVHEFSHVMGLPDLYDTAYGGSNHPGQWSLMASGSYLNRQNTPPMYSAYERAVMGWLTPIELSQPRNMELNPSCIADGFYDAYQISTPNTDEYYIIENRQKKGWDEFIPSEGMLIWHIDYNSSIWSRNVVNNTPDHQYVDIVESNPKKGSEGTPFPGCDNIRTFSDDSDPSITPWSGTPLNKRIDEITLFSDNVVSFRYNGGEKVTSQLKLNDPEDITFQSATVSWQPLKDVDKYFLNLWRGDVQIVTDKETDKTSFTFESLEPKENYTYTVSYLENRFLASSEGSFQTTISPLNTRRPQINEPSDITANSAVASWGEMEGAETYSVSLFTGTLTDPETTTLTFDNNAITDGWFSNSNSYESTSGYYGSAAPALRLVDKQYLNSPQFLSSITKITFVARRFGTAQSTLLIEGRKSPSSPWTQIFSGEIARSKSRKTFEEDAIGDGITEIRFSFTAEPDVRLSIDDIAVTVAESYLLDPVANQSAINVGNKLTYRFRDLEQLTNYFVTVVAHSGTTSSMESLPVKFTTLEQELSAIDNIDSDSSFYLQDRTLHINAAKAVVSVITPDGKVIASGCGKQTIELPAAGLYIVRAGTKAHKVIVK